MQATEKKAYTAPIVTAQGCVVEKTRGGENALPYEWTFSKVPTL